MRRTCRSMLSPVRCTTSGDDKLRVPPKLLRVDPALSVRCGLPGDMATLRGRRPLVAEPLPRPSAEAEAENVRPANESRALGGEEVALARCWEPAEGRRAGLYSSRESWRYRSPLSAGPLALPAEWPGVYRSLSDGRASPLLEQRKYTSSSTSIDEPGRARSSRTASQISSTSRSDQEQSARDGAGTSLLRTAVRNSLKSRRPSSARLKRRSSTRQSCASCEFACCERENLRMSASRRSGETASAPGSWSRLPLRISSLISCTP